jgi:hypothetical protein
VERGWPFLNIFSAPTSGRNRRAARLIRRFARVLSTGEEMSKLVIFLVLSLVTGFQLSAGDSKKYVGRYELESGLIPISTLDVSFADGALWVKPGGTKKRRLIRRAKPNLFFDGDEGTYKFNLDKKGEVESLTFVYEGSSYTADKRELPPPSLKGYTTFKLEGHPDARIVALAGSFNRWNQSQLLFAREGAGWVCRIDLAPGKHTYKFIVDGNWIIDPANPKTEEDDAGNVNSVLVIEKK